jgi:pimeloyl-ACP methyl ester carboxylesterase
MSTATTTPTETVELRCGELPMRVRIGGSGDPLVYLHSTLGPAWDPFLAQLATRHTVYLPEFPGTSPADPHAIHLVDELADLVLAYEELIRQLGLTRPAIVGHSFGGMLAAELAAYFPALPSRLVLLAPLGLWRDDAPVGNWSGASGDQLPALLFHDPAGPATQATLGLPAEPEAMRAAAAGRIWAAGCMGKFVWPIPDRGLRRRLHRVAARTLIVWGRQDRLVPVSYADEFAGLIADSKVIVLDHCGHIPQREQAESTASEVAGFLA